MSLEEHGMEEAVSEGTTWQWHGTLVDPSGTAILGANVTAITGTLTDGAGVLIPGRPANQDLFGQNGGTISAGGVFTFIASPGDAVTIGTKKFQPRRLTLKVTYNFGFLTHQVRFFVLNLTEVP